MAKRRPSNQAGRQLIGQGRAKLGLRAAMRDPITGKVYSGRTHQEAIETVPKGQGQLWARLYDEWDKSTPNSGFLDERGNFVSRDKAEKDFGVLTMEDVRDWNAGRANGGKVRKRADRRR